MPSTPTKQGGASRGARGARGARPARAAGPTKGSSKRRGAAQKAPATKGGLSTPAKVVVVVFAVLMALSLMLPSLAAVFNVVTGKAQGSQTVSSEDLVKAIDEQYSSQVDDLAAQLEADPDDADVALQLANAELGWAAGLRYYGTTDEVAQRAQEQAESARTHYDVYLKAHEGDAEALTSRAMAAFYAGDTDEAVKELEAVTSSSPDYATAWANLGMLREVGGDTEGAVEAYREAVAKDPDDEAGAKSYAQGRLEALGYADDASGSSGSSGSSDASGSAASDASGSAQ